MDPPEKDDFRLLKVKDPQRGVCKNVIQKVAYERNHLNTTTDSKVDEYLDASYWADNLPESFASRISKDDEYSGYMNYFPQEVREEDIEVVLDNTSTNPLALYDFTITTPATNSAGEAAFYSSSFILGTLTGGINVKAKGNFCKTPEDYIDEDFDYCAINKFNFAAQATGG